MFVKISGLIFLLLAVAWLQGANFYIFGVKPNWILAVFVALVFVIIDFWFFAMLVFLTSAALRFQPDFSWELTSLVLIALTVFFLVRRLPWKESVNFFILMVFGSAVFYLLINPAIFYVRPGVFLLELVYNLILGFILLLVFEYYAPKSRFRF